MRFFVKPPFKVTNFNTSPMPPLFENFSLNTLISEEKLSVKNRSTGRLTGDDFEIYRSGRKNPDRFHLWFDSLPLQIARVRGNTCV